MRKFLSLMMMLSSKFLASFIPPSSGEIIVLLFSSLTDTCNNNFGVNCCSYCPSIDNLMQPLSIGDCKTWGWCRIQLPIYFLTYSMIFVWLCWFGILYHNIFPAMIALHFFQQHITVAKLFLVWRPMFLQIDGAIYSYWRIYVD